MMDPSAQSLSSERHPPTPFSQRDDDTAVTPPQGEKSKARGLAFEEKTLKFRFPPPKGNDGNVNPLVLHTHWMHEVKTAFGDSVVFFDNSNCKVGKLDPLRTMPESPTHHLSVHKSTTRGKSSESPNNTTHFILHRMQSSHTLSEIKNTPNVAHLMQKYNFYVNHHRWYKTDRDTNQLGFFYDIDPLFYDLDLAMCKIQDVLKKNSPRMKALKFRFVNCTEINSESCPNSL
jgi:hypothetical protein